MIGRLRGKLVAEQLDGKIVLDVNGVGYELSVPLGSAGRARGTPDDDTLVFFVHTHVREDTFDLFGFATEAERAVFRLLIGVPNVGPRTALNVLSALPAHELADAVQSGDLAKLNKVPGVGKKTAERLVLELKEKLSRLQPAAGAPSGTVAGDGPRLVAALTSMGYRPAEAERAVKALGDALGKDPLASLLREALAILSG